MHPTTMPLQFFYFDMGNVLLRFSHERQAEQTARVAGVPADRIWQILYAEKTGLHWAYERGDFSREQFYAQFCELAGCRPDIDALDAASNDIFELNVPIVGLVCNLARAGYRVGVLSNTSDSHWQFCASRFRLLTAAFGVHALSFRLRAMKPDPRVYIRCTELAAAQPQHIFFTDDRPEHVAAARAAGWDAVQFETALQLNNELRSRGVRVNY